MKSAKLVHVLFDLLLHDAVKVGDASVRLCLDTISCSVCFLIT